MKNIENVQDSIDEVEPMNQKRSKVSTSIFALLLIASISSSGFYAYKYYSLRQDPSSVAKEEVASLVSQVGKLIDLPAEEPTVATVVDADALRSQAFFAKAQKGDKVLIYANAKKAFLYSASLNKIIEVGPVLLGDQNQQSAPAPDSASSAPTE